VAQLRKTVGVYDRPEKRGGLRTALAAAAAVLAVAATAAAIYFI
jgi:hypothetical protein